MKFGVLDIGTNSVHMILVDVKRDLTFDILDRAKEFTRLGDHTFVDGKLTPEAIEKTVIAISRFKKLADIHGVQKIKAVATSAVREGSNGGELIDRISKSTGIKARVITGDEEARLIHLAVTQSLHLDEPRYLIVDIGGGSVEVILAGSEGPKEYFSLKLGTIRLKDLFIRNDPPSKKNLRRLDDHISEALEPVIQSLKKYGAKTIIGTSGTILNLISMAHWLDHNEPLGRINQHRLPADSLMRLHEKLIESDLKGRLKMKGLDTPRADMIITGSAVLTQIIEKTGIKEIMACDAAIREGIVYEYVRQNRPKIELEAQVPDIRLRSVLSLARKCAYEEEHAHHVTSLALSLFDQTKKLHRLGDHERRLLQYASILHDIGYHISFKKHHRHTYYLIKNGDLSGLTGADVDLLANIARYHCSSVPKKSHENFQVLSRSQRHIVKSCASILRLADALDRSHFSVVSGIACRMGGRQLRLGVKSKSEPELEIWSAQKKKDLFEKTFKIRVEIVSHKRGKRKAGLKDDKIDRKAAKSR